MRTLPGLLKTLRWSTAGDAGLATGRARRQAQRRLRAAWPRLALPLALVTLVACGGGSNPFDNPPAVDNPVIQGGRKLSFAYYQRCVHPVLLMQLPVVQNGVRSLNTCAAAGCHDDVSGTGGALRVRPQAAAVNLADTTLTPEAIRGTEMYRNFYSAQGESIPGQPLSSRLLLKPLLQNMLHGGGLIFENLDDPQLKRIAYWINRPMPAGQDEFSAAAASMFTPADIHTGVCNAD
ncbi:MAG: hypothetical protein JNJ71_16400 [Rubrivivax sp.]|nr:hypothetical protein [Rubrivivax sp.]